MDQSSNMQQFNPLQSSLNTLQQFCLSGLFSKSLQRKLNTLSRCNFDDADSTLSAMQSMLSVAHRAVDDLAREIQVQHHVAVNIWTAVRSHGCQFLGPAMQEDVLRLILLALEDGSSISRKVLVLFVVQRLHFQYPQASKTAVGHVVQLLYRASCFHVIKRDEESSLMQLKEEFRNYDALRCQHDAQIVEISLEFGLRILPEQWSCLLYGDASRKSHMQSIVDKLLKMRTFVQSVENLFAVLKKSVKSSEFSTELKPQLDLLTTFHQNHQTSATVSASDNNSCLEIVIHLLTILANLLRQKPLNRGDNGFVPKYSPKRCNSEVQTKSAHTKNTEFSKISSTPSFTEVSYEANDLQNDADLQARYDDGISADVSTTTDVEDAEHSEISRPVNLTSVRDPGVVAHTLDGRADCSQSHHHSFSNVAYSVAAVPDGISMTAMNLFPPSCSLAFGLCSQAQFLTLPVQMVSDAKVSSPSLPGGGNFCPLLPLNGVPTSNSFQPFCFPIVDAFGRLMPFQDSTYGRSTD